ncbi:MAG: NrsF family protein, partial [Candidatus Binataceae bacterium]
LGIFVLLGTLAGGLALRTALPNREATSGELGLLALIAAIGVALVVRDSLRITVSLHKFVEAGIRCALCTGLLAALPWCALFWAVRRGATLMPELAGGLIGIAAFSFGFAASRLGCPIDNAAHILLWHVLPLGLGTGLSVVAGIAWLQRGTDRIRHA